MKNKKLRIAFLSSSIVLIAVVLASTSYRSFVRADQFDAQIQQLQQENSNNQQVSDQLAAQASSYQDAVDKLQTQIDGLQQAIVTNQHESDSLKSQIEQQQKELDYQKEVLGKNIKAMYLEGKTSTLEVLASSKDLSEYVNKEQYRLAVQDQIKTTLDKINQLKQELQSKQEQVDQLIKDQQKQKDQLADSEAQQAQLLAYTAGQKSAYDQQIKTNQSKIADLRRQQALLNAKYNIGSFKGDPNRGGYPLVWYNAPQDSIIDSWGMYNRECVSYTAFKVHQDYIAGKNNRDMPFWGGVGNANQWDDDARAAGIPVDYNPTSGSIAISNAGFYGHAMYVEAVGTVNGQ
jgi:peptidoglycan hydrolase CwlO-like protein